MSQGINIYGDQQLREMAAPVWDKLTPEQKDEYKHKAKSSEPMPNQSRKIYNSLGQVIEEVEAAKAKEKEKETAMEQEIEYLVTQASDLGGELKRRSCNF